MYSGYLKSTTTPARNATLKDTSIPASPIPLPIHPSDNPKPTQQSSKTRSDRQPYQPQVLDEAVNTGGFHWMRSGAMYRFFLVLDFSRCWISVSGMTSLCSPLW